MSLPIPAIADALLAVVAIGALLLGARVIQLERLAARLRASSAQSVSQLETLYDVALATASRTEVDEIVQLVVDHATDLLQCSGAMIALEEPGRGFIIRAQRKYAAELRDPVGLPLVGIALEAIETWDVVAAERYRDHRFSNPKLDDLIASAIAVPLIVQNHLIGTLTVYSRTERSFDAAARRSLRSYGAMAAVAIANAKLLGDSRRMASDDPLTGLLNRRLLVERLDAEVSRSTRHGDAFCVVLCDIDGLKEVNDAAGHLVGDQILKITAAGLRDASRAADIVARFGGDEFVLLLPTTTGLQGQALVARALTKLREATYTWGGRELPLPRVSMGLATFPDDGLTADTLIAAADARMYADKARARHLRDGVGQAN